MNRIILHIDADAFFASIEQGFNPLLRGKPVIVGGESDQKGCVHTASYEARRMGIKTGMPLREAKRLCPDAVFLKGDYRHYKAAGETIREALESFSPRVEVASVDDAYMDLTGTIRRFGQPSAIAREIKRTIFEKLHITVSIGIASSKLIARIASGTQKPDGLTLVPPEREREFLTHLPVRELPGVGYQTERMLADLGITTIGGIAGMPKNVLISLFGANGEKIWRYAQGQDDRAVEGRVVAKQLSRETSFPESTEDAGFICGTILYLMDRIAGKLRENGWSAQMVRVRVRYRGGSDDARSQKLPFFTDDTRILCGRVLELYRQLPQRRAATSFVSVAVGDIDWRDRQTCLIFNDGNQGRRIDQGIDTVRQQFGFTAVGAASTLLLTPRYRREKHGYILHNPALCR